MSNQIILGTVRGRNPDGSYLVVKKDGKRISVIFPSQTPSLGSDVIGNIEEKDGKFTMTLKPTLLDAVLDGNAKIIPVSKRTDITARILARLFERAKSAVFKPGVGMAIERSPNSDDENISWAMEILKPEADRLGIALNVIDVKAVARSEWDMRSLQSFSLPADIEGSRRGKDELTKILRSGFHPACSRIIEHFTGSNDISVNFVLPYSPFSGALGFARDVGKMDIGVFPRVSMSLSDSRKISSARQMAMAIAHNRLSVGKGFQADIDSHPRVRHLSNSFADATAVLMYLSDGGDLKVANDFASLRQASLFFGYDQGRAELKDGVLEFATHNTINAAIEWFVSNEDAAKKASIKDLVTRAVRIAKASSFEGIRFEKSGTIFSEEMEGAVDAANNVACDIRTASNELLSELENSYKMEISELVSEHADNLLSAQRLMTFGVLHIPARLEKVFYAATREMEKTIDVFAEAPGRTSPASKADFVKRIRKVASDKPMDIEFDDTPVTIRASI